MNHKAGRKMGGMKVVVALSNSFSINKFKKRMKSSASTGSFEQNMVK